ncbi:MAG: urease accessory UreF family protein [Spongiibacteraceae bacterium]
MTMITTTDLSLLRLLQLSSAALPVGGYSFSQGLEYAVEEGWLNDESAIADWLLLQLHESLACVDLPLLRRQLQACTDAAGSVQTTMAYWNAYALACRETAELRLTDTAMGAALTRLLESLAVPMPFTPAKDMSFISVFAMAAAHWQLDARIACHGYLWSWLENQIAAATKIVPLGQTSAQRLLGQLLEYIPAAIDRSATICDEAIGASLPALAMASAWHETQYTRLFRS